MKKRERTKCTSWLQAVLCSICVLSLCAGLHISAKAEGADGLITTLADGEYAIDVTIEGGSGKASVESPTLLIVEDGMAYASLTWSSAYYDYMLVDGIRYENRSEPEMNSTFLIPILKADEPMTVIADTTAMGAPHEIEYALTFYSDSIADKGELPKEQAKKVVWIALAIIVFGGILNVYVKKKLRE